MNLDNIGPSYQITDNPACEVGRKVTRPGNCFGGNGNTVWIRTERGWRSSQIDKGTNGVQAGVSEFHGEFSLMGVIILIVGDRVRNSKVIPDGGSHPRSKEWTLRRHQSREDIRAYRNGSEHR